MTRDWAAKHGFTLFPETGFESVTLTCVNNGAKPGGRTVDVAKLQKLVKDQGFLIDGGYGKIKGTTFRISNMGDETEATMSTLIRRARWRDAEALTAQVRAAHLRIVAQGGGLILQDDATGLEHVAVVRDFEREVGVLFDEQDGDAVLAVDLDDLFENRFHEQRRDAERRLVEHEEFRLAHQRAADGEHLLFAAGQRAGDLAIRVPSSAGKC